MARAYGETLTYYRDWRERDGEEGGFDPRYDEDADRVLDAPPDEVSWLALAVAAERDPAQSEAAWGRIKAEARSELDSGQRAALALSPCSGPWERAQFLAIRQSFIDEWEPRGGIGRALIDSMAHAHTAYLHWMTRLHRQAMVEALSRGRGPAPAGPGESPRLRAVEAMEQAAAMADRFNRLFLRSLRSLRDLRRYNPSVVVQGSAQINVAERQVNVNGPPGSVSGDGAGLSPSATWSELTRCP